MKPRPDELIIELSRNCNLACTMCGFGGGPIIPEQFMSMEVLELVLDALEEPPKTVRLNGRGESTIHPHFVAALRLVRERFPASGVNLFSHLSSVKRDVLGALIEHGVQLFISMDSPDPDRLAAIRRRSSFTRLVANIDRLGDVRSRPFIIFTLQEQNFDDVESMARFAVGRRLHLLVNAVRRDEGIEPFQHLVRQRTEVLRAAFDAAEALYEGTQLQCILPDQVQGVVVRGPGARSTYGSRRRCPAIERELCVLHDGTVTPCNMFNPYVYGNILEESLAQIRSGSSYRWFSENHKTHYYCANCACLGGTAS